MDRRVTDNQGDSKRQGGLPAFFEGYAAQTSPFGNNTSGEQAYKRAERIVAALYLVTNHVSENEPLRTRVRERAGVLLEHVLSLDIGLRSAGSHTRAEMLSTVREIISLLRTLHVAGLISGQNADILIRACDNLGQFVVHAGGSALSEQISLTREDLLPTASPETEAPARTPAGSATGTGARQQPRRDSPRSSRGGARTQPKAAQKHNERRDTIVNILRKSGPLGIKDIAAQIPDCSEKTVQRELAALAEGGVVRASGEKRWRTYALV